jgi:hypothetical protein
MTRSLRPILAAALMAAMVACGGGSRAGSGDPPSPREGSTPSPAASRPADAPGIAGSPARVVAPDSGETHLAAVRQITFGGENAEAYFSRDGQWLTFQSTRDGRACDQQYVMRVDGSEVRRVSDGRGKTTCGWFLPGDRRLFFASSTAHDSACPPRPDPSRGYVWPLDRFDLYTVNRDGTDLRRLRPTSAA